MKKLIIQIAFIACFSQGLIAQSVDPVFYGLRKNIIKSMMNHLPFDVGIGIIHIQRKDTMLFNNNYKFPMQSVYKLPIGVAVLDRVDKGKISLDNKIKIKKSLILENTHSPIREKYGVRNLELSIGELLENMVRDSDNNACDILLKKVISPKKVDKFIAQLDVDSIKILSTEGDMNDNPDLAYDNYSTPLAMCDLLYKVFYADALSLESREYLKSLMTSNSKSSSRLGKYLPEEVVFYNKTGTGPTNPKGVIQSVNDVGIMEIDANNHIIISIFMRNVPISYQEAQEMIAGIGKIIYKTYSNN